MEELPFNQFDLDPGRKRSIILDCVDLTQLRSNDMRDIRWTILDKLTLPDRTAEITPVEADSPIIIATNDHQK